MLRLDSCPQYAEASLGPVVASPSGKPDLVQRVMQISSRLHNPSQSGGRTVLLPERSRAATGQVHGVGRR